MDKNVREGTTDKDVLCDPMTEIIRNGARQLLEAAYKVELRLFLEC